MQVTSDALLADFLARGGAITKCPPAFSAPSQATIDPANARLIASHTEALEARRYAKFALKKGYAHGEIVPRVAPDNVERKTDRADRREHRAAKVAKTSAQEKTPDRERPMRLDGLGTRMNVWKNATEEVVKLIHPNGRVTMATTDYQGRRYRSHFSQSGRYEGQKFLNRSDFVGLNLK